MAARVAHIVSRGTTTTYRPLLAKRCIQHRVSPLLRQHWKTPSIRLVAYSGTTLAGYYAISFLSSDLHGLNLSTTPLESDDEASDQSVLLACSSSVVAVEEDEDKRRLNRRILQWMQTCIKKMWDLILVSTRSLEIAVRLSPLLLLTPAAVASAQFLSLVASEDENTTNLVSDLAWAYTIHAVQGLGPVAVKLCQWMATRRDIFPPHVCDRLSKLHDAGYPHSWKHTQQTLSDCFENFDEKGLEIAEVIGCGSAAQVYRGTLTTTTSSGQVRKQSVAIKVLHPRFQELVDRDFVFIQALADLLHTLPVDQIRMINLPRVAENFGAVLRLQSDLSVEAANLHRFRANFYRDEKDGEGKSSIFFPRPMDGWTCSKAMVEEFVGNATPISQYLKDSSPSGLQIRKELAGPLLRAFLKMVFIDNFVHSDLHPGNVLVIESPMPELPSSNFWTTATTTKNKLQQETSSQEKPPAVKRSIVFLDAGICNSLSPEDQQNLSDLFRAVIFNDGNRAGRLMVERAKYERCSQTEGGVDRFAKGVEDIVSEFHDRRKDGLTLGAVRIGSLLTRVLDLCRDHGVEIDPSMANVVLSTLVLEGLGRSLEPNLNLIDFAKPFILGLGRV